MCGHYYVDLDESQLTQEMKEKLKKSFLDLTSCEVFPSQEAVVLVLNGNDYEAKTMRWGFEGKSLVINARSESLHERKMFQPCLNKRCLVVASGFYEWSKGPLKKKVKINWNENVMLMAGIYNSKNEFVIVTGESSGQMRVVHHRTPILIHERAIMEYLTGKKKYQVDQQGLKFTLAE